MGFEHPISPLSKIVHCVCDRNRSDMMNTSNTSKVKNYQFIRAFQSDRFTPDLPMFVNTKTITFITLSCADYTRAFVSILIFVSCVYIYMCIEKFE